MFFLLNSQPQQDLSFQHFWVFIQLSVLTISLNFHTPSKYPCIVLIKVLIFLSPRMMPSISKKGFLLLIPEILQQVSAQLTQFDILNLMKACKHFYQILKPILYQSVTIHCDFGRFDKEFFTVSSTYIRTMASTLEFLSQSLNFHLVRSIVVLKLPFEFISFEKHLRQTFFSKEGYFVWSLQRFICHSPMSLSLLEVLAKAERLNDLSFRINVFDTKGKFQDVPSGFFFHNLSSLCIGPFQSTSELLKLLLMVKKCPSIRRLRILGSPKKIKLEDLISRSYLGYNSFCQSSLIAFQRTSPNLDYICMESCIFHPNDIGSSPLIRNPSTVVFLSIVDANEISITGSSVFDQFSKYTFSSLKYLRLSIRQPVKDSTAAILLSLKSNTLVELDLELMYNSLKADSLKDLTDQYISGIIRHSKTLRKLSFAIFNEKGMVYLEQPLSEDQFKSLFLQTGFPHLENLRVEIRFTSIYNSRVLFFRLLPALDKLWILGSHSVKKHWGLGNTYPGIFDAWLRIQYIPELLIRNSPSCHLRYIKIDQCLFHVKQGNANPKDHIDDWFSRYTRVQFPR